MGKRHTLAILATSLLLFCITPRPVPAQTPTATVTTLDDARLSGTWYEIARLPNKHQKHCVSDVFRLIARGDKPHTLQWVDSCKTKSPYPDVHNLTARPQDKHNPSNGHLKVTTLWPFFTTKYWFLAVDPSGNWFLIGSPNHKSLWIYSRTPILAPDALAQIESQAAAQGYATANLVLTRQTIPPTTTPAIPVS